MLKNQDAVPEPQISVSQARVTPDELTQALAAIESRRQAEASRLAGTIPIDQAISDLHLDSTSDEIWAEVQAQRAKASASQLEPPRAQVVQSPPVVTERKKPRYGWMAIFTPILIGWVLIQSGIIPQFWGDTGNTPHLSTAAPMLRPLASIPDGQEVYADDSALTQLSEGKKPLTQIAVSQNVSGNRWPLFKRDGHVYLRGYIESTNSLQPLTGKPLNIYNDDNSGELHRDLTSNITLRVDNIPLQKSSGNDSFSGITVTNFQPDPLTTFSPGR